MFFETYKNYIKVSDRKSYSFLESESSDAIIVAGHPLVSIDSETNEVKLHLQEEALKNALKLYTEKGGKVVIWLWNWRDLHSRLLKEGVNKNKKKYTMADVLDSISSQFSKIIQLHGLTLKDIWIVFQDHANWYVKSNIWAKKRSESQKLAIKYLLLSKTNWERKTNCKWTFVGFLKLTERVHRSAKQVIVCFWADNRCSHTDMARWVSAAQAYFWHTAKVRFAYFWEGKRIPLVKCQY